MACWYNKQLKLISELHLQTLVQTSSRAGNRTISGWLYQNSCYNKFERAHALAHGLTPVCSMFIYVKSSLKLSLSTKSKHFLFVYTHQKPVWLTRQICTDMLHMRDKSLAETYCTDFLSGFFEKSQKSYLVLKWILVYCCTKNSMYDHIFFNIPNTRFVPHVPAY